MSFAIVIVIVSAVVAGMITYCLRNEMPGVGSYVKQLKFREHALRFFKWFVIILFLESAAVLLLSIAIPPPSYIPHR